MTETIRLVETAKFRWKKIGDEKVLQTWWAPDLPGYMVDARSGEWRDVPTVEIDAPERQ